jgi:hypothetical protein
MSVDRDRENEIPVADLLQEALADNFWQRQKQGTGTDPSSRVKK